MIRVRRAEETDQPAWAALLAKLHEDTEPSEFEKEIADWVRLREPYVAFLAEDKEGAAVG